MSLDTSSRMSLPRLQRPVRGILLDISGVLKDGGSAIPGSVQAVNKLRDECIPFKLVTNETQATRSSLTKQLTSLGFSVEENDIIQPCPALANLLRKESLRPHLLVHPDVMREFDGIDVSDPNCVVIGDAAHNFTYEALNEAFKVLMNLEKPRLFSLGMGRYYREKADLVLDVGVFTTALEYATGVSAEVIGKPQKSFFMSAITGLGVKPEETIMIGDDIVSDVGGAQACGLMGILVRTGKFRSCDENHPVVKPDMIVDNLEQAISLMMQK